MGIKKAKRGTQEQKKAYERILVLVFLCVQEPVQLSVSIPVSVPSTDIFIFFSQSKYQNSDFTYIFSTCSTEVAPSISLYFLVNPASLGWDTAVYARQVFLGMILER